jgi:hypothetical protein
LEYAVREERAVLTFNICDFAPLHDGYLAGGKEHFGIVFSTEEVFRVLFRRLVRFLSAEELRNQTRWLNEFK